MALDMGVAKAFYEDEQIKNKQEEPWLDINLSDLLFFPEFRIQFFNSL